jgi:hypothetical protein
VGTFGPLIKAKLVAMFPRGVVSPEAHYQRRFSLHWNVYRIIPRVPKPIWYFARRRGGTMEGDLGLLQTLIDRGSI